MYKIIKKTFEGGKELKGEVRKEFWRSMDILFQIIRKGMGLT